MLTYTRTYKYVILYMLYYYVHTCVQMYMYVCTYRWPCGTHAHIPLATFVTLTIPHTMYTYSARALDTPSRRDCLTAMVLLLWSESQVRPVRMGRYVIQLASQLHIQWSMASYLDASTRWSLRRKRQPV